MSMHPRKYAVIVRVGDRSLHEEWLFPDGDRNFDMYVSYFGNDPDRFAETSDYYEARKGPKYIGLSEWMNELGDRMFEYDAIWFPDDDIRTNAANISRMFDSFSERCLMLAQPALKQHSYFQVTAQHIDYLLRYTYFVEAMVPVFSTEALRVCLPTFSESITGWGLEHVWAKLLGYPERKMAILDAVPVKHTRPPGQGELYDYIKNHYKVNDLESASSSLLRKFGINAPRPEDITFYDGIRMWEPSSELYEEQRVSLTDNRPIVRTRRRKLRKKRPALFKKTKRLAVIRRRRRKRKEQAASRLRRMRPGNRLKPLKR